MSIVGRQLILVTAALAVTASLPASSLADRTEFRVQFACNDRGMVYPLPGARVDIRKRGWDILPKWFDDDVMASTHTDGDGRAAFIVAGDEDDFYFRLHLDDGAGVRVEDWYALWAWYADTATNQNDVPVQDYGTQGIGNGTIAPECAVFEGARRAYHDYWAEIGERPPYGSLKINVNSPSGGTPFARYTTIHWPPRYPTGSAPGSFTTSMHEFAHTFRHAFDGSFTHFLKDVVDFKYLQRHSACKEVSSSAFAFNEGWAEYWSGSYAPAPNCPGLQPDNYRVEGNVAAALTTLDRRCPGVDRPQMVDVLRRNRGRIHSFENFQSALGCRVPTDLERAIIRSTKRFSLITVASIGKRQQKALRGTISRLRVDLRVAETQAKRLAPCPPTPCELTVQQAIRPSLIRAELGQARLLHDMLAVQSSVRSLKTLGEPMSRQFHSRLTTLGQVFRRSSAELGVRALAEAVRRAGPMLRRDSSAGVQRLGRALGTTLATFRSGRLPAAFVPPTPGSPLPAPATALPAPAPPPAPTPEPTPAPTPTPTPESTHAPPKADLVVDRVYLTSDTGWMWNVEVRNAGAGGAPATQTSIARAGQTPPDLIETPALAPGESVTVRRECPYGSIAEVTARADATEVVDESHESNNEATGSGGTGGRCRYP